MHFLLPNRLSTITFDAYFKYIESIRNRLSPAAYAFASNYEHYSMQSKKSLHDAWIQNINVEEVSSGSRNEIRQLVVRVSMLGPYHDCVLKLVYEGVAAYSMNVVCETVGTVAHGDVVVHEVSMTDAGLIAHEILFESGSTFCVQSSELRFQVEPL